jgi:hypothetical protein
MEGDEAKRLEELAKKKRQRDKKRRVSAEEKRLRKSYEKIPAEQMGIANGLIRRAAFMLVSLEDYEADLDDRGYVEQFTQSEKTAAYERERPVARLYNQMNRNYQQIIKQLTDLIPKGDGEGGVKSNPKSDGFDEWTNKRDELANKR